MIRFLLSVILPLMLVYCSGGSENVRTPILKPTDLVVTNQNITVGGSTMRLGYVLDRQSKSVVAFNVLKDDVIDTLDGDRWSRTPIPVGGDPVSIIVDEEVSPHRIFVADQKEQLIWAYELTNTSFVEKKELKFQPVSLGIDFVTAFSQPIFFDEATPSQATLQNITVTDMSEGIEAWRAIHRGSEELDVLSSISGKQSQKAIVGQSYQTDDGELSFIVQAGARRLNGADRFHFSTMKAKPLPLTGRPMDLLIHDRTLFILTQEPDEMVLFDLDSLTIESTIALTLPQPTSMALGSDEIYIVDAATNQVEVLDLDALTLSDVVVADHPDLAISQVVVDGSSGYLLSEQSFELIKWNLNTQQTIDTLELSDRPMDMTLFAQGSSDRALVSLRNGNVDLLDMDDFERIDTNTGRDSNFQNLEFFDVAPFSKPELISVGTIDGKTRSEQWQVVYEGVLPTISQAEVNVSGTLVTFSNVDLSTSKVQVGDQLVFSGDQGIVIQSIDSNTELTLEQAPDDQGNQTADARSVESYIVIGSKSGLQTNRAVQDETYESDAEEIALFIRSSLTDPVSRDDFFAFQTTDGIIPIQTTGRSLAVKVTVIQKQGETFPTGYVIYQGSGALGRISLRNQRVNKIIR